MDDGRKLVKFDLTREEIPPLEGHDWTKETPYAASMINEDLRVVRSGTVERFNAAIQLAVEMMTLANPGKRITMYDDKYADNGELKSVIISVSDD
jgi:hypothetical protein